MFWLGHRFLICLILDFVDIGNQFEQMIAFELSHAKIIKKNILILNYKNFQHLNSTQGRFCLYNLRYYEFIF